MEFQNGLERGRSENCGIYNGPQWGSEINAHQFEPLASPGKAGLYVERGAAVGRGCEVLLKLRSPDIEKCYPHEVSVD